MSAPHPSAAAERLRTQVSERLASFQFPGLEQNLQQLNAIQHVALTDNRLHIELQLPFVWRSGFHRLRQQTRPALCQLSGASDVVWRLEYQVAALKTANNQPPLSGVKNIIAISSCKGGVGKSTTAVNIALALSESGVQVGLLDADIYGPSLPKMLGSELQRPGSPDGQHMGPIMAHGLATNSIGYLIDQQQATVWRGPMASKALLQLLNETLWPELDYLIVDMPPGTGDIQLTLAQSMPVTGAAVITTPQDISLIDARKGILMFQQVSVPIAGIIENMSYHICRHCGHQEAIFGQGGAQALSEQYRTALLGQMPLHSSLREDLDAGIPTMIRRPDSEFADIYRQMAEHISGGLYWQNQARPETIAIRNL